MSAAPTRPAPVPPNRPAPGEPLSRNNGRPTPQPRVSFGTIAEGTGHRMVLYGPGGIGKTTLAATAPGPVAGASTWQDIRDALHAPGWDEIKTIVIDSATRAEELAVAHTIATVPHEKREIVIRGIEDYGFGKGYSHVFDTFLTLLGDLDQHTRAGRHVILICHDCTNTVPNPHGDDWLRYEPRLQCPSSGKAAIRLRVREWADHVLFLGYDVDVREGKGTGSGTRTIYPCELPHCMAKSRTIADPLSLTKFDTTLWAQLLK